MDNGLEGSKFLDFAQSVSERRRFRGCGVSLGRLGFAAFAGGLGVMEAASAASLGSDWPISILGFKFGHFRSSEKGDLGLWGGFAAFGLRGWAGGDGGCQCWEFGPDWPISILGIKL